MRTVLLVIALAFFAVGGHAQTAEDLSLGAGTTFSTVLTTVASGVTARISVIGSVTLGATFVVTATGAPYPTGTTFLIIANDGADPVIGTFAGLPEGARILTGNQSFVITYTGGTGNDVVLIAVDPAPGIPALDARALIALAAFMALAAVRILRR